MHYITVRKRWKSYYYSDTPLPSFHAAVKKQTKTNRYVIPYPMLCDKRPVIYLITIWSPSLTFKGEMPTPKRDYNDMRKDIHRMEQCLNSIVEKLGNNSKRA